MPLRSRENAGDDGIEQGGVHLVAQARQDGGFDLRGQVRRSLRGRWSSGRPMDAHAELLHSILGQRGENRVVVHIHVRYTLPMQGINVAFGQEFLGHRFLAQEKSV